LNLAQELEERLLLRVESEAIKLRAEKEERLRIEAARINKAPVVEEEELQRFESEFEAARTIKQAAVKQQRKRKVFVLQLELRCSSQRKRSVYETKLRAAC
jgi:ribosomal protein L21